MTPTQRWGRWPLFWWPALLFYSVLVLAPVGMAFYGSLFRWSGVGGSWTFVGVEHYLILWRDSVFWHSLGHNLVLLIASVLVQLPVAFCFAWLLTRGWRGQRLLRTLFFIPMVMPTVAIALLWVSIYDPHFGLLNHLASGGSGRPWTWGWLGEEMTALPALLVAISWRYIGFHLVLMVAGIEGVPSEYLEAARMEGASESQVIGHVVLPLLRPVLWISLTLAVIGSLKYFDIIYVMTGGDGPAPHATELVATYLYKLAFQEWRLGYGSAVAFCLLGITLAFSLGLTLFRRKARS